MQLALLHDFILWETFRPMQLALLYELLPGGHLEQCSCHRCMMLFSGSHSGQCNCHGYMIDFYGRQFGQSVSLALETILKSMVVCWLRNNPMTTTRHLVVRVTERLEHQHHLRAMQMQCPRSADVEELAANQDHHERKILHLRSFS